MTFKLEKNVQIALKYGEAMVGTKYRWWLDGDDMLTDNEPA